MCSEESKKLIKAIERRRFVRVDIYAVTRYFSHVLEREVGIQTRISDISEGGLRMMTFDEGIPVDTLVSIRFFIPAVAGAKECLLIVTGKVRHTGHEQDDMFRSGVEFVNLDADSLKAIRNYVAHKSN